MNDRNRFPRLVRLLGWVVLAAGLVLLPPVFERTLAMARLLPSQRIQLWVAALVVVLLAAWMIRRPARVHERVLALVFMGLLLTGLEFAARTFVVVAMPGQATRLARLSVGTYPEYLAYKGHPFLQFIGTPSITLVGNEVLGDRSPFNNFGYHGDDFEYAKPEGVVRIVALGGSTTATGYPEHLQDLLNEEAGEPGLRFEALNFAHGWYTSAHVVANFVFSAVDFDPDYVIVHSGWNDRFVRDTPPGEFRTDYSHAFKSYDLPLLADKYPLRLSVIYREIKFWLTGRPHWYLEAATSRLDRPRSDEKWSDLSELETYRRNIETVVDLARLRGVRVVLTTQPHTTDPGAMRYDQLPHLEQTNAVMREIAAAYGDAVLFVDLDTLMTGTMNEEFVDLGHVTRKGRQEKARHVGAAILAERAASAP